MTLVVALSQVQVVAELGATRAEIAYEAALQAAESGANEALHRLSRGTPVAAAQDLSLATFREELRAGRITLTALSGPGDAACATGLAAPDTLVSFGVARGALRKLHVQFQPVNVFELGAIHGFDPSLYADGSPRNDGQVHACHLQQNAVVHGKVGVQGLLLMESGAQLATGPLVLAGPSARILPSLAGIPAGQVRPMAAPLRVPTADEAANTWAASAYGVNTTSGTEYFQTRNHNTTGFRYLVFNMTTLAARELPGTYSVVRPGDAVLETQLSPTRSTLEALGMTSEEVLYGVRVYPGDYFFRRITLPSATRLFVRAFSDVERDTLGLSGYPDNPNPGCAARQGVRFWVSRQSSRRTSTLRTNTILEGGSLASASRLAVFAGRNCDIQVRAGSGGTGLRANILAVTGSPAEGYSGSITLDPDLALSGSLLAWEVDVGARTVVTHEAPRSSDLTLPVAMRTIRWEEVR